MIESRYTMRESEGTVMEIETLRNFLAVAQEENITRAAEYLHLTQPTLSRQIQALEEEFGKKLLIRGKRRITLTQDGILFRKRAAEIISLVDKTDAEMKEARDELSGDIFIGAGETDVMRLVAQSAQKLRQQYPGIRYRIISGAGDAVMDMLGKGLIDFGLVFGKVDELKYDAIPLGIEDSWGVILPEDSQLARKKFIRPDDLWNVPLILSQQALEAGFLQTWLKKDVSKLNIAATYTLILNAEKMVAGGLGYAMALDRLVNLKDTSLCFRPCRPSLKAGISILSKKYQVFSPPAQAFRDLLILSFQNNNRQ